MASIYERKGRTKLWCRLKGADGWFSKPTPFAVGQEESAQKYADLAQKKLDEKAAKPGPMTVRAYFLKWIKERESLGIASVGEDKGRITNHVLPHLGSLQLGEVRPRHVRDMIRALRKNPDLAARTILNIYGITHRMFEDAMIDEQLEINPCKVKHGDLPQKLDKDPEWRALATYSVEEVFGLLTSDKLLVERRVQYALKSLAGLRHSDMSRLCVRNYEPAMKPLGRLLVTKSKTKVTRWVPVHPVLARILKSWLEVHWPRIYGRDPEPDDLLIPTRNMTAIAASDAVHAFKDDLDTLGFRVDAGEHRDRGGHDLRAWFITSCIESGASFETLGRITHTKKSDVMNGYYRAQWPSLCAEVAKLSFEIPDEKILALASAVVTAEGRAGKRWRKRATPMGFERDSRPVSAAESPPIAENHREPPGRPEPVRATAVASLASAWAERAMESNDLMLRRLVPQVLAASLRCELAVAA